MATKEQTHRPAQQHRPKAMNVVVTRYGDQRFELQTSEPIGMYDITFRAVPDLFREIDRAYETAVDTGNGEAYRSLSAALTAHAVVISYSQRLQLLSDLCTYSVGRGRITGCRLAFLTLIHSADIGGHRYWSAAGRNIWGRLAPEGGVARNGVSGVLLDIGNGDMYPVDVGSLGGAELSDPNPFGDGLNGKGWDGGGGFGLGAAAFGPHSGPGGSGTAGGHGGLGFGAAGFGPNGSQGLILSPADVLRGARNQGAEPGGAIGAMFGLHDPGSFGMNGVFKVGHAPGEQQAGSPADCRDNAKAYGKAAGAATGLVWGGFSTIGLTAAGGTGGAPGAIAGFSAGVTYMGVITTGLYLLGDAVGTRLGNEFCPTAVTPVSATTPVPATGTDGQGGGTKGAEGGVTIQPGESYTNNTGKPVQITVNTSNGKIQETVAAGETYIELPDTPAPAAEPTPATPTDTDHGKPNPDDTNHDKGKPNPDDTSNGGPKSHDYFPDPESSGPYGPQLLIVRAVLGQNMLEPSIETTTKGVIRARLK